MEQHVSGSTRMSNAQTITVKVLENQPLAVFNTARKQYLRTKRVPGKGIQMEKKIGLYYVFISDNPIFLCRFAVWQ